MHHKSGLWFPINLRWGSRDQGPSFPKKSKAIPKNYFHLLIQKSVSLKEIPKLSLKCLPEVSLLNNKFSLFSFRPPVPWPASFRGTDSFSKTLSGPRPCKKSNLNIFFKNLIDRQSKTCLVVKNGFKVADKYFFGSN